MPAPKRNTTQRGYGVKHQRLRRIWQQRIDREGATCARCGQPIDKGTTAWDLGHTADRTDYTGPEHTRCNRSEGARRGNAQRKAIGTTAPQRAW